MPSIRKRRSTAVQEAGAPPALPPPPGPSAKRPRVARRLAIASLVLILVAGATVATVGALRDAGTGTRESTPHPSADATATTDPTPSPMPEAGPDTYVIQAFNEGLATVGDRLWFNVNSIGLHSRGCTNHAYTYHGETVGAFYSDCVAWERYGVDLVFFHVTLNSVSREPVPFNLRDLVLVTRDGRSIAPLDVLQSRVLPAEFLPQRTTIAPFTMLRGYLMFDGRVRGVVPHMITYRDGQQTLSQVFRGTHSDDEETGKGVNL